MRGTVRDPNNKDKVAHLSALADALPGTLKLYAADLMQPGSFDEAIRRASQLRLVCACVMRGACRSCLLDSLWHLSTSQLLTLYHLLSILHMISSRFDRGADVVFHTASPFQQNIEDPQRDLVDPAVKVCHIPHLACTNLAC